MSEYWKSLPRKYCDTCKCWFADNRASIEFHEKGKRHQENVQKRINEIQKKGLKEYKAKQKLEDDMQKIEKAALEAFKKDMKQNPDLTAQSILNSGIASVQSSSVKTGPEQVTVKTEPYQVKVTKEPKTVKTKKEQKAVKVKTELKTVKGELVSAVTSSDPPAAQSPAKVWYEGVSEEGYSYYWNTVTSESQWEPPEEGYISLQEQNELYTATENSEKEQQVVDKKDSNIKDVSEDTEELPSAVGPQPKPDPYGQWVTVEKKEEPQIDWELPVQEDDKIEVYIPVHKDESLKIKEKTIGHLSEGGESTFKKRKNLGSMKRNVRQRFDES